MAAGLTFRTSIEQDNARREFASVKHGLRGRRKGRVQAGGVQQAD